MGPNPRAHILGAKTYDFDLHRSWCRNSILELRIPTLDLDLSAWPFGAISFTHSSPTSRTPSVGRKLGFKIQPAARAENEDWRWAEN